MTRSNQGRKGLIWLTFPLHSLSLQKVKARAQGTNSKSGIDAETIEKCCFLAGSLCLVHLAFLYNPGPYAQGIVTPTVGGPTYINQLTTDLLVGQSDGSRFSANDLLSNDSILCQADKKPNQHLLEIQLQLNYFHLENI